MSFVSVLARTSFLTVCTDGQGTYEDGEIAFNDYQKFVSYDGRGFIAFTGSFTICEMIVRNFKVDLTKPFDFADWAERLSANLEALRLAVAYPISGECVQLAFGGKNSHGEFEVYSLNSNDYSLIHEKPQLPYHLRAVFLWSDPNLLDLAFIRDTLGNALEEYGRETPEQLLLAQRKLNGRISEIDPSVNDITFSLIIR
jgi:hypothetical protein